jgi:hypothetical protein
VAKVPSFASVKNVAKLPSRVIVVDDQVMRCRLCERTGSAKSGAQPSQSYLAKAIHELLLIKVLINGHL